MSWGDKPTISFEGKVVAPTQGALFSTLVLMLNEQGAGIDVDQLYERAIKSDQDLLDILREESTS